MNRERLRSIHLAVALAVLPLFWILPEPEGLSFEGKMMLGILVCAIVLWLTEALPYSISGLLIMILQPLLIPGMEAGEVFASFGNNAVFFLLGAFIMAAAIEKYDLHKLAALRLLRMFGSSGPVFVLGIMLSGAVLTFIMPEHGVVALLIPIVVYILIELRRRPLESNFGKASVIGVTFGCSIGSLGTMIGGARNPLTVGFLNTEGLSISFLNWMVISMPVVFLTIPLVWVVLISVFPPEDVDLRALTGLLSDQVRKMGPLGAQQKMVLVIIAATVLMWVLGAEDIGLAVIALAAAIMLFITGSLNWADVESKVPWGILLLYGGAITLGHSLTSTGAAIWISDGLVGYTGSRPWVLIITLVALAVLLTNLMSNTAAVAILLPISVSLAGSAGSLTPEAAAMTVALSGGMAFVLVIATPGNLIAYSSGYFSIKDLMKVGLVATLISMLVIVFVALSWWRLVGLW